MKLQMVMVLGAVALASCCQNKSEGPQPPPPTFKETNMLRHIPQAELPTEGCDLYRAYQYNSDILFIVCANNPATVLHVPHQEPG